MRAENIAAQDAPQSGEAATVKEMGTVPRNWSQTFKVSLCEFEGRAFAEIQLCRNACAGDALIPTSRQLNVPIRRIPALIDLLQSALDEARRRNLFREITDMGIQVSTEYFTKAFTQTPAGIKQEFDISLGNFAPAGACGPGVTVVEKIQPLKHMICSVTATVACVDAATSGSQGTLLLGTFPEGNILFLGAVVNLTIARVGTNIAAGAAVIGSIGTVVAGVDTTLTGTEANFVASTACTLTAGAGAFAAVGAAPAAFDGTAGAKSINLNFVVPDADSAGNDSLTVTGTVDISYIWLGDK